MSTNFEYIEFTDTRPGYESRSGQFITVPKQVMRDPNLSDAERTVLLYLHDRAGNPNQSLYKEKDKKFCRVAFPSFETIAEDTVRSVRQAKDIVKSLRIKGYVKVTKQKTTKGEHNLYTIQFPASYQALDKVNTFTLFVATGKNLAKDEATVPTTEASANTRTGGCANTRTQSSANTRTVNSSLETAPIETGTSTFLTERSQEETDSNLPRENQEVPLVETNIPGQDYKEILVEEIAVLSSGETKSPGYSSVTSKEEEISSGMAIVNEDDLGKTDKVQKAMEEYRAKKAKRSAWQVPSKKTEPLEVVDASLAAEGAKDEAKVQEIPVKPQKPVWTPPERREGESDDDYESRVWRAGKAHTILMTSWKDATDRWEAQYGAKELPPLSDEGKAKIEAMRFRAQAY